MRHMLWNRNQSISTQRQCSRLIAWLPQKISRLSVIWKWHNNYSSRSQLLSSSIATHLATILNEFTQLASCQHRKNVRIRQRGLHEYGIMYNVRLVIGWTNGHLFRNTPVEHVSMLISCLRLMREVLWQSLNVATSAARRSRRERIADFVK